jgi:hypothetical protein
MPWADGIHNISINKAPSYLDVTHFPDVTKISKRYLPNAIILVTVCNPSPRLYSDYQHKQRRIPEQFKNFYIQHGRKVPQKFTQFIELLFDCSEGENDFCVKNQIMFLDKGKYASHIKQWERYYGDKNILVVNMEDDPSTIATQVLQHVGSDLLPMEEYPWEELLEENSEVSFVNDAYEGRNSAYKPNEMQLLVQYYSLYNEKLADLLHETYPLEWNTNHQYNNNIDM